MGKTLRRELLREIRNSRNRFLSIFVMVALGVMFLVGLRSAAPDMRDTADRLFDTANFHDIEVLSTLGLTEADVQVFSRVEGVEKASGGWSVDAVLTMEQSRKVVKAVSLMEDFDTPTVLEGRLPETAGECAVDEKLLSVLEVGIGDTVTLTPGEDMEDALAGDDFTVTGVVNSPLYIALDRGTSTLGDGSVSAFVLLPPESFRLESYTVCDIRAEGAEELDAYGMDYEALIGNLTQRLEETANVRAALRYEGLLADGRAELEEAQLTLDEERKAAEQQLADGEAALSAAREELEDSRAALEANRQLAEAVPEAQSGPAMEQITAAEQQLAEGEVQLAEKEAELERTRLDAAQRFLDAQAEIDRGRVTLDELKPADVYVLDRNSNFGFVSYDQNAQRMENLARMFPLIFFVVAALVCLTTMTRMVEEERTQIGSIKAMGYGTGAIAWKFLIYGMLAAIGGTVVGAAVGTTLIPWVIFTSYNIMYTIPELRLSVYWGLCLGAGAAGIACTVGATLWAMLSTARATPAALMRPKAPKAGKRIFLERITPLWKRLSFSMKVSARNLLRYKKRFWMTVIGVAGCTALMIAGLGLRTSLFSIIDIQFGELYRYHVSAAVDTDSPETPKQIEAYLEGQEGVESIAGVSTRSVRLSSQGGTAEGYLTVTDDPETMQGLIDLRTMEEKMPLELAPGGVIIDEKLAELLGLQVGDSITVDCGSILTATVSGITEHYIYHYVYMTAEDYTDLTGDAYIPNEFLMAVHDDSKEAVSALSQGLMEQEGVRSVSNLRASAQSFRETMEVVDAAVAIIVLSAAALALVVLYNLTNINITERIRELATIKVLGFFDTETAIYVYRENFVLTALGIGLGQLLGRFLCAYLIRTVEMDYVMFGRTALPRDYLLSVVLSLIFAILVNTLMYFRIKKIDMVQSLKSVE